MEIDIREKQATPAAIRYSSNYCVIRKSENRSALFIYDHSGDLIELVDEEDCNNLLRALQYAKELGWF